MAQPSPSHLRADRMYCIERRGRGTASRRSWATNPEQAWDALRVQLIDDMAAAGRCRSYRTALAALEHAGPRPAGWEVVVLDRTYRYEPRMVGRPEAITRGEAALWLAMATTRP